MSTPLPCPFCGGAPNTFQVKPTDTEYYSIDCRAYGCVQPWAQALSADEVLAKWNRRAPPSVDELLLANSTPRFTSTHVSPDGDCVCTCPANHEE